MPFRSTSQQKWMFATHPAMAKKWAAETPSFKNLPEHVAKHADGGVTDTVAAQKERVRGLVLPRHACGNVAEPDRMARGGVRAPHASVRAPHVGVRAPHAGIGKFVLPRHADGSVTSDQPQPSILDRIRDFIGGLGTLRKAGGDTGPPESPQAKAQREQQEKERWAAEDRDRASKGLPPKPRITPGWSK